MKRAAREAWVPARAVDRLVGRIGELERRAARLDQPAPRLEITDERRADAGGDQQVLVRLTGSPPKLNGWRIVGELHHGGDRTEVEPLGPSLDAARWETALARCDHCGLRRDRKHTLVLRHDSGTLAQIGTSCVADFTGDRDALGGLRASRLRRAAREALAESSVAEVGSYAPLRPLLAHAIADADARGFVGRREATDQREATYAVALKRCAADQALDSADYAAAAQLESWVLHELAERDELSGYEKRLVAAFQLAERVDVGRAALVVSAIVARRRDGAQAPAYLGEVGETVTVEVEVLRVTKTKRGSRFGDVYWHRMRDQAQREVAWYAVGTTLSEGASYTLRGRVRRHDTFRGRPRTVLERCWALT